MVAGPPLSPCFEPAPSFLFPQALDDQHAAVAATLQCRGAREDAQGAATASGGTAAPSPVVGTLTLLQHPPVYTLGSGATLDHLKFDPDHPPHPLFRVERGGEATHHCPGQLTLYPVLDLTAPGLLPDLHWWLRGLEEVALRAAAAVGVAAVRPAFGDRHADADAAVAALTAGSRVPGLTGAWLPSGKVAAVGVRATRWVTYHGVAINVNPDLTGFSAIVPCGISDRPVTSIAAAVAAAAGKEGLPPALAGAAPGRGPLLAAAASAALASFADVFGVELVGVSGPAEGGRRERRG